MVSFTFAGGYATAETLADELERIANMLREGFTSGETYNPGRGWWQVNNLTDEPDDEAGDDDLEPWQEDDAERVRMGHPLRGERG